MSGSHFLPFMAPTAAADLHRSGVGAGEGADPGPQEGRGIGKGAYSMPRGGGVLGREWTLRFDKGKGFGKLILCLQEGRGAREGSDHVP